MTLIEAIRNYLSPLLYVLAIKKLHERGYALLLGKREDKFFLSLYYIDDKGADVGNWNPKAEMTTKQS